MLYLKFWRSLAKRVVGYPPPFSFSLPWLRIAEPATPLFKIKLTFVMDAVPTTAIAPPASAVFDSK